MTKKNTSWLRRALSCAAAAFSLGATLAPAALITVNTLGDGPSGCTLRNAVMSSNDGISYGGCTAGDTSNTIAFSGAASNATILVNSPPINIYQHSIVFFGNGTGATIIDGQGIDHVFDNYDPGTPVALTIQWANLTVRNGNALSSGPTGYSNAGAAYIDVLTTATIQGCVFTGNSAESSGGAIENLGNLTIASSTFSANSAAGEGGAIRNIGTLTISFSTFSGNSADSGGAVWHSTGGGSLAISNATFSGNTATTSGGAISADDPTSSGPVSLSQVTVAGNSSTGSGGGIFNHNGAPFGVDRSVIALNSAGTGPDCAGATAVLSGDYNVFSSLAGCTVTGTTTNNVVSATPLLGTLANNGGPTQTIALMDGSPAIDIIPTGTCGAPTDQRSVSRPVGPACDAGAFEAPLFLRISPTTITAPQVGVAYGQAFTASNGTGPYTFVVSAGALPTGMSLSNAGVLSGTPTAGGAFSFTIKVTDTFSSLTYSLPYSTTVTGATIAITPTTLPPGTFGVPYSQSTTASGGTAPYSYAITAGSQPPGMSLSAAGTLSGTPTAAGLFTFTDTATDNSTGTGPYSGSQVISITVAATVPGAPTIGTATANDAQATITFTPPGSNGGSSVTVYQATSSPGGFTGTSVASPITVTGLTNGTAYTFTITATNAIGTGPASAASNSVTPKAAQTITFANPGAQTFGTTPTLTATADSGLTVSFTSATTGVCTITTGGALTFVTTGTCTINADQPGNSAFQPATQVQRSFTVNKAPQTITFANPGAQNFGTTPTLTATSDAGLVVSFTSSTTGVCTITMGGALTFVTAGTCTINADQAGNANYLAATTVPRTFTVNAVVPGAPTIGTATGGIAQATITFTPPGFTGGANVTVYTATASPGGATGTGAGSPITVTGLTNGTAYTFTVTATNIAGTGPASAASNSVTPKGTQTITFANPGAQNFGTTPTVTATSDSGLTVTFTSSTTGVCTITTGGALTFVSTGTCTINADQAGNTAFLAATTVSRSFSVNAVVPGAPTIGTATAGNTQATVAFTAPAFTGGATITGYTATSNPGGITGTSATSPITVTGLTNGVAYTFTVTATNSAGTGSASAASNSVMPKGSQTITFVNPGAQNFGTTPTLTATSTSGLTVTFTSSTTGVCTITTGGALTFVTAGTCTINADQAGNSSYLAATQVSRSFAVNAVAPGAPTIGTATPGNSQVSVAFTAPASNGGAPITSYTVTCTPGPLTASGAASPVTVTGLTNGSSYLCSVTATNSAGTGAASATVNVTPALTTFTGPSPTGGGTITASFTGGGPGCTFASAKFIPVEGDPLSPPAGSAPNGVGFPQGLFDFTTSGCTPASTITMTVVYPTALPVGVRYWKYGPTAQNTSAHWYTLPTAALTAPNTIVFSITDGGIGDDDLTANGTIVDQGGPGLGGSSIPTLGQWMLLALMLLLGLAGARRLRAR